MILGRMPPEQRAIRDTTAARQIRSRIVTSSEVCPCFLAPLVKSPANVPNRTITNGRWINLHQGTRRGDLPPVEAFGRYPFRNIRGRQAGQSSQRAQTILFERQEMPQQLRSITAKGPGKRAHPRPSW